MFRLTSTLLIVLFYFLILCGCTNANISNDKVNTFVSNIDTSTIEVADKKIDGWNKEYYPSGLLKQETYYVGGKKNGKSVHYFENGSLSSIASYKNDSLVGEYISYYPNGQKNFLEYFRVAGIKQSKVWYDNGVLKQEGPMNNGKMDGKWVEYYRSGVIYLISYYSDNKKTGTWVFLAENGDTIKKEVYENNLLLKTI